MSKKDFKTECMRLEALGYCLLDYQPEAKYAKYILNGSVKVIGTEK